ncbi:DUF2516 family protein [Acrocarpospora macrocephala]|nr:DUF2516 family protein [Acrocarpospora macrocephala]
MMLFNGPLDLVFWAISLAALGMSGWALLHAIRIPAPAFKSAGKLTKNLWTLFLGLATFFTFVAAFGSFFGIHLFDFSRLNIFTIAAVIASGIYLADVKPAVNEYRGGGSSNQGPYGPW